jgi:hypothetical protein
MGEFRGLSRLVSTDIGPHTLPQQSTGKGVISRRWADPRRSGVTTGQLTILRSRERILNRAAAIHAAATPSLRRGGKSQRRSAGMKGSISRTSSACTRASP